ncbi:MAG: hypothetical protein ACOYOB_10725 [Myxococcota bacterium]
MTVWMPRLARPLVALAALAFTVSACGPSEEGETRKWDANKLLVQEFSSKFAALKPSFDARQQEAQLAWDKAKALTDKDQRAQEMRKANELLTVMLTPAQDIDRKFREIDQLRTDPSLVVLPAYQLNPVLQATDWQVQQVRASLQTGPSTTPGEAIGRLRAANDHLARAREPLDRLKAQVAERQRLQNAATTGQAAPGSVPPGAVPPGSVAPGALPPGQPMPGGLPPAVPTAAPDPNGPPGNVPLQPLPPPGTMPGAVPPGAAAPAPGAVPPGAPPAPAAKPF